MRVLVTGANGHLGQAIMRLAPEAGLAAVGLDRQAGAGVDIVCDLRDRDQLAPILDGFDAILHCATLHKPHVVTHERQAFVDTNITGTLNLLEALAKLRKGTERRFVLASTTSVYARAMVPQAGGAAVWVDEDLSPAPKNIYGITKFAAEDLCRLFARKEGLSCSILRLARFFPEADDSPEIREDFADANAKANEFLFRRVDIEDAARAMIAAMRRTKGDVVETMNIAATSPFCPADVSALAQAPAEVVARYFPEFEAVYATLGFHMFKSIGRVYDNGKARDLLDWTPAHSFESVLAQLDRGQPIGSALAQDIGILGYHAQTFTDGPYPAED